MQDARRCPNQIKLRAVKPTAHVKKTLSSDMCGVTIFRRMFRSLGMTWWRCGCSGPRTLRGAFKCHGTLPMCQGRTHTAPKVNYARTCRHEPPVLMPTYTSMPFFAVYYQFPVFYTSNVAPNKVDMEMYIQHTSEKRINTET